MTKKTTSTALPLNKQHKKFMNRKIVLLFSVAAFVVSGLMGSVAYVKAHSGNNLVSSTGEGKDGLDWQSIVEHTQLEEQEGKDIWSKLQNKALTCDELTDEDFSALGEYFMGEMAGSAHPSMNAMMVQVHGQEGENQIHITVGKRLSGCEPAADISQIGGWLPMMGGVMPMMGSWSAPSGNFFNSMMGFGNLGFGGWLAMVLWWLFVLVVIVIAISWLVRQFGGQSGGKSDAVEVLKTRYAKGEIDEKEFKEKLNKLSK